MRMSSEPLGEPPDSLTDAEKRHWRRSDKFYSTLRAGEEFMEAVNGGRSDTGKPRKPKDDLPDIYKFFA